MSESTLSVDYFRLYRSVSRYYGGVNTYYESTVTVVDGVVTLAAGTFPTWAAAGIVQIGANHYTVNTRDSDTQVTLDDTSVAAAAGTAYLLTQASEIAHDDIRQAIVSGLRKFRNAYRWRFLRPVATISTVAPYSTGTVTISSGVVTFSEALPATVQGWAADGELVVAGESYTIDTYDSTTQVTLDDTSVTVAAATSFTMGQIAYQLPDNFAAINGPLTYRPGAADLWPPLEHVSELDLRRWRQRTSSTTYRPTRYATRVQVHDATVGTRYDLLFGPEIPDAVYTFDYRYTVRPDNLTPTNKYPLGSMEHSETVLAAVMSEAEIAVDQEIGVYTQKFMTELQLSQMRDDDTAPDTLGMNTNWDCCSDNVSNVRPWNAGVAGYEGA
jgi:hypothetical protein